MRMTVLGRRNVKSRAVAKDGMNDNNAVAESQGFPIGFCPLWHLVWFTLHYLPTNIILPAKVFTPTTPFQRAHSNRALSYGFRENRPQTTDDTQVQADTSPGRIPKQDSGPHATLPQRRVQPRSSLHSRHRSNSPETAKEFFSGIRSSIDDSSMCKRETLS